MLDAILIALIALVAALATGIDNLIVLSGLLALSGTRRSPVFRGYMVGSLVPLAGAWLVARAGTLVPVEYLGLLGLVPLVLGVLQLSAQQRRGAESGSADEAPTPVEVPGAMTLALTFLALNGDALAVFVPLMAESPAMLDLVVVGAASAAVVFLWWAAILAVTHPGLHRLVQRWGPKVTPYVLIAVGLYVLADTPTDLTTVGLVFG